MLLAINLRRFKNFQLKILEDKTELYVILIIL